MEVSGPLIGQKEAIHPKTSPWQEQPDGHEAPSQSFLKGRTLSCFP